MEVRERHPKIFLEVIDKPLGHRRQRRQDPENRRYGNVSPRAAHRPPPQARGPRPPRPAKTGGMSRNIKVRRGCNKSRTIPEGLWVAHTPARNSLRHKEYNAVIYGS